MAYAAGRIIHDADSHICETDDWLEPYLEPKLRGVVHLESQALPRVAEQIAEARRNQEDSRYRAEDEAQLMLRKNWHALGSFRAQDRPKALDLLGFQSQLVFNTSLSGKLNRMEHGADPALALAVARAHNRAMRDFCAADPRLLPTGYVPLVDRIRAKEIAQEVIAQGFKALLLPSECPKGHSPSHVDLDGVWARAQEAGLPVLFHVGGGGDLLPKAYAANGLPAIPDFLGGDENFTSVSYMAIPQPPMLTLSALIFDGVLERFPRLKFGVIEQGASWLPGWMRNLDSAGTAFAKNEERLRKLSLLPSEYVRRQVRVTPYPHEDTAWIIAQSGPEICLFSSDYPHVEGGRNPLKRFDDALAGTGPEARRRFYSENFIDLMGEGLAPALRIREVAA